ncbi:hypothetical protein MESS2_980033 [Mesorhizobium metallidurans STM 2683]|uniref:Uncharacterized protein n=1 Tax=Mesorhizobium metallidurans STM 2683 TaxID=1297569 RepID=M5FBP0_9HYPH|nr:hypothetical protein MESS2_980033 [Mesorhizobium metallidurans STM 2683]
MQDCILSLRVQDQAGGVGFGVAADDEDSLSEVDKGGERVLGGGGLADAALSVKGDLTQT